MLKKIMFFVVSLVLIIGLFNTVKVEAASSAVSYAVTAEGSVEFSAASRATNNHVYAQVGENVEVKVLYTLTLEATDTKVYCAINNSARNNIDVDLGVLEHYATRELLEDVKSTNSLYEKVSQYINTKESYVYTFSSEAIQTLLNGEESIKYNIYTTYNYAPVQEGDIDKSESYKISTATERKGSLGNSSDNSGCNFKLLEPRYEVVLNQEVEEDKYKVGDTMQVKLIAENKSDNFLEDAQIDIYNSKDKKTHLSNVSNVEIVKDNKVLICNDSQNVNWPGSVIQSSKGDAILYIGTWSSANDYFTKAEDNNLYITFDYTISEEDLNEEGNLDIYSVLTASSPKKAFNENAISMPGGETTLKEGVYPFTGRPLEVIENVSDDAVNTLTSIFVEKPEVEIPEEIEKPEVEKPVEKEKPNIEQPDVENPIEKEEPETELIENFEEDNGDVLGATHKEDIKNNNVQEVASNSIVQTGDYTSIVTFVTLCALCGMVFIMMMRKRV